MPQGRMRHYKCPISHCQATVSSSSEEVFGMTPSLQGTPELRQLTGMALPGTSAAGKCFVRNCGGHGATPAAHQGESISCCCEGQ